MKHVLMAAAAGLAIMAAASQAAAEDPTFTEVVVFGDSLSDAGNYSLGVGLGQQLSFTTNPGDVAVQYLADYYGLTLEAALAGGSDYAYGGAGILNNNPGTPAPFPTLTGQVNNYVGTHATIDPNALFVFWGGANDIFYQATLVGGGLQSPAAAVTNMGTAGTAAGGLLDTLQGAGANLIVVLNLPDTGRTPAAAAANLGAPGFAQLLTAMAQGYNTSLDAAMFRREGVVPVNVYAFFNEVLASPGAYGFTNTTGVACLTPSSLICSPAALVNPNAASTYLFADGVHPTTAAHRAVADLMISEIAAPQQISMLPEGSVRASTITGQLIDGELANRLDAPASGTRLFAAGGYLTGTTDAQRVDLPATDDEGFLITVGATTPVTENLIAGFAVSVGRSKVTWDRELGNFETNSVGVAAFGQYGSGDGLYLNGQLRAQADFYDVERSFMIGAVRRDETSSPTGTSAAARLGAGYWFGLGGAATGPFASAEFQRSRVGGFYEDGASSSTMTFSDQTREALVGQVGWAIKGTFDTGGSAWRPYASVAYAHDAMSEPGQVKAGLVTLNGNFTLPGYQPEESWVQASAGVAIDVSERWGARLAYAGHFGDGGQDGHSIAVGLNASF